jgi:hypothetical protein
MDRQWFDRDDSPAGPGLDKPQQAVRVLEAQEQTVDVVFECASLQGQLDRLGGSGHPVEVKIESKRASPVEAKHLEHPIAAEETVIGEGQEGFARAENLPVNTELEWLGHYFIAPIRWKKSVRILAVAPQIR